MKSFAKILKRLPLLALTAITLSSCVKESGVEGPDPDKLVKFLVDLPAPAVVETRSVGTIDENTLSNMTLLAFDKTSGKLMQKIVLSSSALSYASGGTNGNRWQFTTMIAFGNYDLVALANTASVSSILDGITPATLPAPTKTSVAQALSVVSTAKWGFTGGKVDPLPMWGEMAFNTSSPPASPEFKMTRMQARINVSVASGTTNFRLTSIRYYNYSSKGFLIPQTGTYSVAGDGKVNVWAPSTYGGSVGTQTGSLLYSGTEITDYKSCTNRIYVFEAATRGDFSLSGTSWKNNPCLVIGGQYYNGSSWGTETFYRVDFIMGGNNFYPVLRNHSYNVTINSVGGPGYANESTALGLAPVNMDASTYVYNESGMRSVSLDGPYYLMASESQVELEVNPDKTAGKTLVVKTNFPYGWQAAVFTNEACTIPQSDGWLTVSLLGESGATSTAGTSIQLKVPNSTGKRYIKFTAGRMSFVVSVPRTI